MILRPYQKIKELSAQLLELPELLELLSESRSKNFDLRRELDRIKASPPVVLVRMDSFRFEGARMLRRELGFDNCLSLLRASVFVGFHPACEVHVFYRSSLLNDKDERALRNLQAYNNVMWWDSDELSSGVKPRATDFPKLRA